jgi:hypothetical protein
MVSDFFERSPVLLGPVIALLIFAVVFTATAVHALRMHKETHDRMAKLPLEDERRHG